MREKEAKKLLSDLCARMSGIKQEVDSMESHIEVAEADNAEIFLVEGEPAFAKSSDMLFPTLASRFLSSMPRVIVNMGAVPFVCNGADVMAPGIVRYEGTFAKEDLVVVLDERHNKPISIALSLYGAEEARKLERGKVLKNIHYVGDAIWSVMKQLSRRK